MDDDVTFAICRLCLEIIQNGSFKRFKNIELDMLDVLTPTDVCIKSGSVMCISCHKNLLACYQFKSVCLEMNEQKKTDKVLNDEGTQATKVKVCSLCFENIDDEMMREIFLGVTSTLLAVMLERCLPELNTHQMDTAGCTKCFKSLEMMFSFINKWLITEEKLEKYCTAKNINKNELKLLKVVKFFQPCSESIAHPQIENSRISSNYGGFTSTNNLLISNIKSEPGQDISNNTERNEEALKDSYINMNPDTTKMNNLISSTNSKFISANNFSHCNVKLEPVEHIHEFMGNNEESYLENGDSDINNTEHTQTYNDLTSSNYNVVTFSDGSFRPSIKVGLGQDVNTFGVFKINKHEDQRNEGNPEKTCLSPSFSPPCCESTNNKDVKTIEQNEVNMEEGVLPSDLCQDPSALATPDFANLNQATQRESRSSDLDDDPDKKRRKCAHTTATSPNKEFVLLTPPSASPENSASGSSPPKSSSISSQAALIERIMCYTSSKDWDDDLYFAVNCRKPKTVLPGKKWQCRLKNLNGKARWFTVFPR